MKAPPAKTPNAPTAPAPPATDEPPNAMAANGAGLGVDVETVESPAHQFSVFYVPASGNSNAQSVVIWIGED
jgi:hypothetical protein